MSTIDSSVGQLRDKVNDALNKVTPDNHIESVIVLINTQDGLSCIVEGEANMLALSLHALCHDLPDFDDVLVTAHRSYAMCQALDYFVQQGQGADFDQD